METKPIRASKTVRGLVIAIIPMLQYVWLDIDISDVITIGNMTNELYDIAVQLVGIMIAFYGRLVAQKPLSL